MLRVEKLTVTYPDGNTAVTDLSFHVGKGETIALLGANGAGKSSLMQTILGITPSKGSVTYDGILLSKKTLPLFRQKIGLVFQNPDDQIFMAKVVEDVAFGPKNMGKSNAQELAMEALSTLQVSHLADRIPGKLSGGEKRMVALAGILAMSPELVLFDEPTSFLDGKSKRTLLAVLAQLPMTKIIATHDLEVAKQLCNRVLVLQKGRLVYDGGPNVLDSFHILEGYGL